MSPPTFLKPEDPLTPHKSDTVLHFFSPFSNKVESLKWLHYGHHRHNLGICTSSRSNIEFEQISSGFHLLTKNIRVDMILDVAWFSQKHHRVSVINPINNIQTKPLFFAHEKTRYNCYTYNRFKLNRGMIIFKGLFSSFATLSCLCKSCKGW